jgi:hypothetical protein
LDQFHSTQKRRRLCLQTVRNDLERYLEDALESPESFEEKDILSWWKDAAKKYPKLAKMAQDILVIQATSVASESVMGL